MQNSYDHQPSDRELVEAFQAGDTKRFDELWSRHERQVFRRLYVIFENRTDAEEQIVTVAAKVFNSLGSYTCMGKFHHWLHRIASTVAYDELRRRRIPVRVSQFSELNEEVLTSLPAPGESPEVTVLSEEAVRRFLSTKLTPRQRDCTELLYQGYLAVEVAEILGMSEQAIANMRRRIMKAAEDFFDLRPQVRKQAKPLRGTDDGQR